MGFIDRIHARVKALFMQIQTQEQNAEQNKINIHFDNAEDWINKESSEQVLELDKKINAKYNDIKAEIIVLKENLTILKNAQLMNKNIVVKAQQIMQGNRDMYIKRAEHFIDAVLLSLSSKGYFSSKRLLSTFEEEAKIFLESTGKSYYVLQEFFAHESGAIVKNIKQIENYVHDIKSLIDKTRIAEIYEAKEILKDIVQKKGILRQNKIKINENKKEIHKLIGVREKYEEKLESLKKSSAFEKFNHLLKQKEEILASIQTIDKHLYEKFSILDRPLRKYARISLNEKLINKYLVHAMSSLSEDKEVEIADLLLQLKQAIHENKVDLKDKQSEKALSAIESLSKKNLHAYQQRYELLKTEKLELDRLIKSSSLMQDYNDVKYKIEHYHDKSKRLIDEINALESLSFKLQIEKLKESLVKTLQSYNSKIVLSFTIVKENLVKEENHSKDNNLNEEDDTKELGNSVDIIFNDDVFNDDTSEDNLNEDNINPEDNLNKDIEINPPVNNPLAKPINRSVNSQPTESSKEVNQEQQTENISEESHQKDEKKA